MWKTQCQLGGEKKATKFMVKYFAKKNGEPEKKKEPKVDAAALHLAMAASAEAQEPKEQLPEAKPGTMVCAGSLDWVTVGGGSIAADDQNNLWGFHRISTPVQIRSVASGTAARHVIAIDTGGGGWALELQGMFLFTAIALGFMGAGRFSVGGTGGKFN